MAACEADVVAVGVVLVIVSVFNFVAACAAFRFLVVGGVVKSHKKTYVLNAGKKSSASMITSRPDPFFSPVQQHTLQPTNGGCGSLATRVCLTA